MTRPLPAMLLVLLTAAPVGAKYVCPPGRFVLQVDPASGMAAFDGHELELGRGQVSLPGVCGAARAGGFYAGMGKWVNRVRTGRLRCESGRSIRLRARFVSTDLYCTRLEGTLRARRGRRVAFAAERIPACGNGIREPGEQCDGVDSAAFGSCCTDDCTVKPGCPLQCDRERFLCVEPEICTYTCGYTGVCQPRARIDCGDDPVCGCDNATTYRDRCAAFADGTGVSYSGPCRPPVSSQRSR